MTYEEALRWTDDSLSQGKVLPEQESYTHVGCCACGVMGKTLYKVGENRYCAQCKSNLRSYKEALL